MKQPRQPCVRSRRALPVVLVVGMLVAAALVTVGCTATPQSATPPSGASAESSAPGQEATSATPSDASQRVTKLEIKDLKVGTGAKVKAGDTVTVDYTGWLMDGAKFDSSLDRGQPFAFVVGVDNVIQGWHDGLLGMQLGGKRQLIIPPDLAYGAGGNPPAIPENATLKFEIDLLKITPGK